MVTITEIDGIKTLIIDDKTTNVDKVRGQSDIERIHASDDMIKAHWFVIEPALKEELKDELLNDVPLLVNEIGHFKQNNLHGMYINRSKSGGGIGDIQMEIFFVLNDVRYSTKTIVTRSELMSPNRGELISNAVGKAIASIFIDEVPEIKKDYQR